MSDQIAVAAARRQGRATGIARGAKRARRAVSELPWIVLPLIAFVAVWWLAAAVLDRARIFPPPELVGQELIRIASGEGVLGSTYGHIAATMYRLFAAFSVSMLIGTLLGIAAGRIRIVFDLLDNVVWVFMAVPSIVWVFVFVVALGISEVVPIAALSALLIPMVLVNVAEGTKSMPRDTLEMARSYKATRGQMMTDVFLPYLVPYLASSARVAFALAVKLIVIAEVVGLSSGIGYEIKYWYDLLFMAPIVAWGIFMIAVGLIVDYAVFRSFERWATRWKGRPVVEIVPEGVG